MTSQQFHNLKPGDLVRSTRDGKTYKIREKIVDESFSAVAVIEEIDPARPGAINPPVTVRTPSIWELVEPIPSVGA